ncbi:hypothetical protein JXA05_02905 [Candidatus Peregrinibacteria bacterium]|nr:hypothetical protein [Candidatus Peregrinibacteria bacterium]
MIFLYIISTNLYFVTHSSLSEQRPTILLPLSRKTPSLKDMETVLPPESVTERFVEKIRKAINNLFPLPQEKSGISCDMPQSYLDGLWSVIDHFCNQLECDETSYSYRAEEEAGIRIKGVVSAGLKNSEPFPEAISQYLATLDFYRKLNEIFKVLSGKIDEKEEQITGLDAEITEREKEKRSSGEQLALLEETNNPEDAKKLQQAVSRLKVAEDRLGRRQNSRKRLQTETKELQKLLADLSLLASHLDSDADIFNDPIIKSVQVPELETAEGIFKKLLEKRQKMDVEVYDKGRDLASSAKRNLPRATAALAVMFIVLAAIYYEDVAEMTGQVRDSVASLDDGNGDTRPPGRVRRVISSVVNNSNTNLNESFPLIQSVVDQGKTVEEIKNDSKNQQLYKVLPPELQKRYDEIITLEEFALFLELTARPIYERITKTGEPIAYITDKMGSMLGVPSEEIQHFYWPFPGFEWNEAESDSEAVSRWKKAVLASPLTRYIKGFNPGRVNAIKTVKGAKDFLGKIKKNDVDPVIRVAVRDIFVKFPPSYHYGPEGLKGHVSEEIANALYKEFGNGIRIAVALAPDDKILEGKIFSLAGFHEGQFALPDARKQRISFDVNFKLPGMKKAIFSTRVTY